MAEKIRLPYGTVISKGWDKEYVELVKQVEAELQRPICGAKKSDGTPCKRGPMKAPYPTWEPNGRCKLHGGANTGPKNGNGLYRTKIPPKYKEIHEHYLGDEDPTNLSNEIAILKTLRDMAVEENFENYGLLVMLIDTIAKVAEKKYKIEEGQHYYIHIESVQALLLKVVGIIEQYIPEPETKARILEELTKLSIE